MPAMTSCGGARSSSSNGFITRRWGTGRRTNIFLSVLFLVDAISSPSAAFRNEATVITTPPEEKGKKAFWQVGINEFFKRPVPDPLRRSISVVRVRVDGDGDGGRNDGDDVGDDDDDELDPNDIVATMTAAPSAPGFPRPLWAVLAASVSTGLMWYAYYKFAVEEELLQAEIDQGKEPRGLGGYGTLGPFTYGLLLGPIAEVLDVPGGLQWSILPFAYLLCSQALLCERVNELYLDEGRKKPLQAWWSLPFFFPFNIVVGLRQVHFLSQYFLRQRGIEPERDPVCDLFPFIGVESLTWQKFLLTPKLWCSLLHDVDDIDPDLLLPKEWQPAD